MKPVTIIAEIGQAHDGSLGILHSYIDAAARCGVNAIKFQTHIADAESSLLEPFRVQFSYVDETRHAYWRRMEFTTDQWIGIKDHCDERGLEFLSSPFSLEAVRLLECLGVKQYKIASGEVTNHLLVDTVARLGKPVTLSMGLASYQDMDDAIAILKKYNTPFSVLQCTTQYPTPPEALGLNVIQELKERYQCSVGLSDHSGRPESALAAVAMGAEIIEAHLVFDQNMFGPDAKASLTPQTFKQMVDGIRFIEKAMASPIDKNHCATGELKKIFGKSLAVNRAMKAGEIIERDCLETKKPADQGVDPRDYEKVIGKTLKRDLAHNDFLQESDYA